MVMASFKTLFGISLEGLRKTTIYLNQENCYLPEILN
jgi:hypothetical protein